MRFEEIPGFQSFKQLLVSSVINNHISHAQIFSGPEGSAALPLALAYARYIMCEDKQVNDSCQHCKSCIKFRKYIHPDLHFSFPSNMDGLKSEDVKSSIYIAEWRKALLANPYLNLEEWSSYMDLGSKTPLIPAGEALEIIKSLQLVSVENEYKLMLIWLPEKMNDSAANKILKTLEEPPPKTILFLITADYENLLETIRSRAVMHRVQNFRPVDAANVLIEKFDANPETAGKLSEIAEGNIADALWMLREGEAMANQLDLFRSWMQYCFGFKIDELLNLSEKLSKNHKRDWFKSYLTYATFMIRQSMLMNHSPELNRLSNEEADFINKFRQFFHHGNYLQITDYIEDAITHIHRNASSKIVFFDLSLLIADLFRKEKTMRQMASH
jgi:DNA polymerase-3 subunit delta'